METNEGEFSMTLEKNKKHLTLNLKLYTLNFLIAITLLIIFTPQIFCETSLSVYLDGSLIMQTIYNVDRTGTLSLCVFDTTDVTFDNLRVWEKNYSEDWSGHPVGVGVPANWTSRYGEATVWSIEESSGNRYLRGHKTAEPSDRFRICYEPGGSKAMWTPPYNFEIDVKPTAYGSASEKFFVGCGAADTGGYQGYKVSYIDSGTSSFLKLKDNATDLCMYTYSWTTGETHNLKIYCAPVESLSVPAGAIKVMTYNIYQATNGYDNVKTAIQEESPDLVGLQETTQTITQDLATDLGYNYFFRAVFPPIVNEGNGILSKYPLLETEYHSLPSELSDPRIIIRAKVNINGTDFQFFCTHFDYNTESTRINQANDVVSWTSGFSSPKIIVGDFNSRTNSQPFNILENTYDDANRKLFVAYGPQNTVSNPDPTVEIDHIFLSSDVIAYKSYVPSTTAAINGSDHRPVVAQLGYGNVSNEITVAVNGIDVLQATDNVIADPNNYTQGSIVLVTSGDTSNNCEVYVDDIVVSGGASYSQNFEGVSIGGTPANWRKLYISSGYNSTGEVILDGANKVWRQSSQSYVKYDYAPTSYPTWKDYRFEAKVKTINLPSNTKWRMNVYNYPKPDTAYDTYRIEVNANGNIYLRKGGTALASKTFAEIGLDPYLWNTYSIRINVPSDVGDWMMY